MKYINHEWQIKFYVYFNAKDEIKNLICRCEFLKKYKILAYVMRDINVYDMETDKKNFLTDYTAYVNQPKFFKNVSFKEFLYDRHINVKRIQTSLSIYNGEINVDA